MNPQTVADFRQFVLNNPAALARLKGKTDRTEFAREAAKVASENGYKLSEQEIASALGGGGADGELSDAQLASVAGGGGAMTIEDTVCMKVYGWCP